MSLYLALAPKLSTRQVDDLFLFGHGKAFLIHRGRRKPLFSAQGDIEGMEKVLNYASSEDISAFEIRYNDKDESLSELLPFLKERLIEQDVSVGLLLKNDALLQEFGTFAQDLGITVMRRLPTKAKPREPEPKPHIPNLNLKINLPAGAMCFLAAPRAEEPRHAHGVTLEESFHKKLMDHLVESGKSNVEVYRKGGITKQVFSKIISTPKMIPTKQTILCLIIGLELPYRQAKELLDAAGYSLSKSLACDVIFSGYLHEGKYDLDLINMELNEYGYPPLGWHPRDE